VRVKSTDDFEGHRRGKNDNWTRAEWVAADAPAAMADCPTTEGQGALSRTGVSFWSGQRRENAATLKMAVTCDCKTYRDLPPADGGQPSYFEYEIFALGSELSLMVTAPGGNSCVSPWGRGGRDAQGSEAALTIPDTASTRSRCWSAEVFICGDAR